MRGLGLVVIAGIWVAIATAEAQKPTVSPASRTPEVVGPVRTRKPTITPKINYKPTERVPSPEEALHLLRDTSPTWDEQRLSFQAINGLDKAERAAVLVELLKASRPGMVRAACRMLIRMGPAAYGNLSKEIGSALGRVGSKGQAEILRLLLRNHEVPAEFMEFPRTVLRKVHQRAISGAEVSENDLYVAEIAALVLSENPTDDDRRLILSELSRRPGSASLWFAASRMGTLPASLTELEGQVRAGGHGGALCLKVAAAGSVAAADPSAARFVRESLRAVIAKHGKEVSGEAHRAAQRDVWPWGDIPSIGCMAVLFYADIPGAREIVAQALSVQNLFLNQAAAIVGARKWPGLLRSRPVPFSSGHSYAAAIGLLEVYHPGTLTVEQQSLLESTPIKLTATPSQVYRTILGNGNRVIMGVRWVPPWVRRVTL